MEQAGIDKLCAVFRGFRAQVETDTPRFSTLFDRAQLYRSARISGLWDKNLEHLVKRTRKNVGRKETPSYAIIDPQSVKTAAASEERGTDGEKARGRKRHIVVDIMGNLLSVVVYAANIQDTKAGIVTATQDRATAS